jgi:hypothetical protein
MFKIRQIRICGIEPFRAQEDFFFSPFFTLLRGKSGAGKTTVLEALALLGHSCVMSRSDDEINERPVCFVTYSLILGECYFAGKAEFKGLEEQWKRLVGESHKEICVQIRRVKEKDKVVQDLKRDLKDEDVIKKEWEIAGDAEEVEFLQQLIEFSRPRQMVSKNTQQAELVRAILQKVESIDAAVEEINSAVETVHPLFKAPQRIKYLASEEAYPDLPPLICYFNTDMYHWGIGLDIRESPKHFYDELAGLLRHRLHLVDGEGYVVNVNKLADFWRDILQGAEADWSDISCAQEEDVECLKEIKFDDHNKALIRVTWADANPAHKTGREFLSSGENQVFSLGIIFGLLRPAHSIVMLDEPDLHMSLPIAVRMYNELFAKSIRDDIQIICVSHLPFIFQAHLHGKSALDSIESYMGFYKDKMDGKSQSCLTLYYLSKDKIRVCVDMQEEASKKAGTFQNIEIEAILRQSRLEAPGWMDGWVSRKGRRP